MASYLRKYGTGTGADIYINIPKAASANHAVSADWTPATGDVKISKDGGAAANIGTLPTAIAMGNSTIWKFVFTDAELQAAFISITISDSATKAVDDTGFSIETYGNASGLHAFDLDTATQSVNVSQISGDSTAADNLENAYDDTAGPVPWHGIIDQGTAQSATATTVVLRAAAAFADDTIIGATIAVLGSTQGYWQVRVITDHVLTSDTVTVPTWTVTPSGTITYKIFATAPGATLTEIATAIWASATRTLTALDEDSTTLDLDATIRAAVGLAAANLDTQVGDLPTNAELATAVAAALTATVADSIPAVGSRPSIAQAAYLVTQFLMNRAAVGTTGTTYKPDGTTPLLTQTLNSASSPTSVARAT